MIIELFVWISDDIVRICDSVIYERYADVFKYANYFSPSEKHKERL